MKTKNDAQLLNFAHNITVLRRQQRLSKAAMARMLHTSVRTISRLENQDMPPGLGAAILIYAHKHFGIPPHELLSRRL